jgi:mycothiol synthase
MSLVVRERLTDDEVIAALEVAEEASEADGVRPLGESSLLRLRDGGGAVLAYDGGSLAGVGILDGDSGELVVRPALRRRGHGRAIATALLGQAGPLKAWAHGELPGAVALARSLGFERFRALWKMRRPLGGPLPEITTPPGVRLRTFEVGADEEAWVRVNARAFADHPEQGRWTRADLERRQREAWFSPEGFFLAERNGELIGFHWTKVHAAEAAGRGQGGTALGEVYVVGVDPSAQGLGLGRLLTLAGLHHLKSLGLPAVMLYADESNAPAIALYEKLGFAHWSTDAMYRSPRPAADDPIPDGHRL